MRRPVPVGQMPFPSPALPHSAVGGGGEAGAATMGLLPRDGHSPGVRSISRTARSCPPSFEVRGIGGLWSAGGSSP